MSDDNKNLFKEIQRRLADGSKIAAIKLYREVTGVGLKEAKDAVERIERASIDGVEPGASFDEGDTTPKLDDAELQAEIVALLGRGEKLNAVRLYREHRNTSLKQAKQAVEDIGQAHGISTPGGAGCLGLVLMIATVAAGSALVVAVVRF